MIFVVSLLLGGAALVLLVPVGLFFVECVLGALAPTPRAKRMPGVRPRAAVVVPAHDEQGGIEQTVRGLADELGPSDRLLVVADNCTDATAPLARDAGAEVIERRDPSRRGKGYALSYAFDHLAIDPPDVVVIVDADCAVRPGSIDQLVRAAHELDRPVQAESSVFAPAGSTARSKVSAFAYLVKNRIRAYGLAVLGLPCQLMGTGFALPWRLVRLASAPGDNIVEDLAMGLDLAKKGYPPTLCRYAAVESPLPSSDAAAKAQRQRWEIGHLTTLGSTGPGLVAAALRRQDLRLLVLALDVMVPPLALLVLVLVFGLCMGVLSSLAGAPGWIAAAFGAELGLVAVAVTLGWCRYGRAVLPFRDALTIPGYVLWKAPIYLFALLSRHKLSWVRTGRDT